MPPRRAQPLKLTEEQQAELRRVAHLQAARISLIDFVRLVFPGYMAGWFHVDLCRKLEAFSLAVHERRSPRMVISAPPQHGKSLIVSTIWPVWHLAKYGGDFVCASFAQALADYHSDRARAVARSEDAIAAFPVLDPDTAAGRPLAVQSDRISAWSVGNGGTYIAVGVGGPLTGRPGSVLSVDDPFKGREEAESDAVRRKVHSWYRSTGRTRIAPGGGILITNTRWHPEDLTGLVLTLQARPSALEPGEDIVTWEVVNYPALATEREPYRRVGDALHPERRSRGELLAIKRDVGEREWYALFQGAPIPGSGGKIRREWFTERYACQPEDIAETADEVWISVDAARKRTKSSDFHALHVWALKGGKRYLLDRIADRMGYPEFERALDGLIAKWSRWLVRGGVLIEDTANGTVYLQVRGPVYLGVALVDFSPSRDTPGADCGKAARATYLERASEAGGVIMPDAAVAPWGEDVIAWWCAFPLGAHDDDVDAASQILMRWALGAVAPASTFDLRW